MNIKTGRFNTPEQHHSGWFRVFGFGNIKNGHLEIWFGHRYISIDNYEV